MPGRRTFKAFARPNAHAKCNTLHSPRARPTICTPNGNPVSVNPAGTDIAGFAIIDTYQHDRIQSTYVVIGTPSSSVGYSISIANGDTCVTGDTKYSYRSKNVAACCYINDCRATARATSAADYRSASAISQRIGAFTHSGRLFANAA